MVGGEEWRWWVVSVGWLMERSVDGGGEEGGM